MLDVDLPVLRSGSRAQSTGAGARHYHDCRSQRQPAGGVWPGGGVARDRRLAADHLHRADAGQCHAKDGRADSSQHLGRKECCRGVYYRDASAFLASWREARYYGRFDWRCPQPRGRRSVDERAARPGRKGLCGGAGAADHGRILCGNGIERQAGESRPTSA